MTSRLLILVGISGSGKSTYAAQLTNSNPDKYLIVNKDKIRELLFGYTENNISEYYKRPDYRELEKKVIHFENTLIKEALTFNKTIIIDSTNLKVEYIKRYRYFNVRSDVKYFDCELKEAMERNYKRNRTVDPEVIKRQYSDFLKLSGEGKLLGWNSEKIITPINLPKCIVFDIDGTLALKSDRSPYDWNRVEEDSLDESVATLYRNLIKNYKIIVCSGRDEICRVETVNWFAKNNLPAPSALYMRERNDNRPDWVIKKEFWDKISEHSEILFMVDDRNQVVDYGRSLGYKILQCEYNNF